MAVQRVALASFRGIAMTLIQRHSKASRKAALTCKRMKLAREQTSGPVNSLNPTDPLIVGGDDLSKATA